MKKPDVVEALDELMVRLHYAAKSLESLAAQATNEAQGTRLSGKADGIRLAQSYVRETRADWTGRD